MIREEASKEQTPQSLALLVAGSSIPPALVKHFFDFVNRSPATVVRAIAASSVPRSRALKRRAEVVKRGANIATEMEMEWELDEFGMSDYSIDVADCFARRRSRTRRSF